MVHADLKIFPVRLEWKEDLDMGKEEEEVARKDQDQEQEQDQEWEMVKERGKDG